MQEMNLRQQKFFNALPVSWKQPLSRVCHEPIIDSLAYFLKQREDSGARIYPAKQNIFAALKETPFDQVKVVIVGQDPYHGPGQAHGLSFSVPPGVPFPPSLRNIFKELHTDIGMSLPKNGTLTGWARQGVLLLNAILTVEEGRPASHANKGWEVFTDAIIEQLLQRDQPLVLLLWGSYAQKKVRNLHVSLNQKKHLILQSAHPSPLSVTGFLGNHHFSKANAFLKACNLSQIDWSQI